MHAIGYRSGCARRRGAKIGRGGLTVESVKHALLFALLTACTTGYQHNAWYHLTGGYEETKLSKDMYAVHVIVNGFTSAGRALEYSYRRAGELCADGFNIRDGVQSASDFYVANGNMVSHIQKPEVTLIVQCK